jgi:hypothetical protein
MTCRSLTPQISFVGLSPNIYPQVVSQFFEPTMGKIIDPGLQERREVWIDRHIFQRRQQVVQQCVGVRVVPGFDESIDAGDDAWANVQGH